MITRLTTEISDTGTRLDQFIAGQVDDTSRATIRKIIELGGVYIDGRRARKCGTVLQSGQSIEMHRDMRPLTPFRIDTSHVVFQDKHIIVLNKPPGIECQPTPARYKGTLYEALQIWLKRDQRFGRKLHIGMPQRLDRDTSGLLVFSIHPVSHKGLSAQFQQRTIGKHYLALVSGCPEPREGTITSLLAKARRSNKMKSVALGGKEAITHYKVLKEHEGYSLIAITLETGRTHQIRVHFSEKGHPLLGDSLYGGPEQFGNQRFTRQCLHAWKLELNHPVTGAPLCFEAATPPDMGSSC